MAIYHFQSKVISRGQGRGIVAAAALTLFMIGAASSRVRASRLAGSTKGLAAGVTIDIVLAVIAAATAVLIVLGV